MMKSYRSFYGNMIIFLFLAFLYVWANYFDFKNPIYLGCESEKIVTIVGGCDFIGICGVTYADGSIDTMYLPTVGKGKCVDRKWFFE